MKQNRTSSERHPYMVKGNYIKLFGHLFNNGNISPEFEKRMRDLMSEDARYVKPVDNHYRNERK